ncbi:MAG: IclR family transcriptional regulator [Methyloligellaceae bacterium]
MNAKTRSRQLSRPLVRKRLDVDSETLPVGKAFAVLEAFASRGAASLTEIALALGLPKTTVHRITTQLETLGYLQREPGSRKLSISTHLAMLASDLIAASMRLAPRHAVLQDLSMQLGESCSLALRVGYEIVYVDDVTAMSPLAFQFQTGRRSPLHCTSTGKLYLAQMSDAELERYLASETLVAHTPKTIVTSDRLRAVLADVAAGGFAASDEEYVLGVVGAAVPVRGAGGRLLAGLTVSIPAARMSYADLPGLRPALQTAAAKLTEIFQINGD